MSPLGESTAEIWDSYRGVMCPNCGYTIAGNAQTRERRIDEAVRHVRALGPSEGSFWFNPWPPLYFDEAHLTWTYAHRVRAEYRRIVEREELQESMLDATR